MQLGDLIIRDMPRPDKVWEVVSVDAPTGPGYNAATIYMRTVTAEGDRGTLSRAASRNAEYRLAGPIQTKNYRRDAAR